MVDFRKLISPKAQAEMKVVRDALLAFAALPRSEMGTKLLEYARTMQQSGKFHSDHTYSYDTWAMYRVMPEVARRLNPALVLEAWEIETEQDIEDNVSSVTGVDNRRLARYVENIRHNGSFSKGARHNQKEDEALAVACELMDGSRKTTILTVAMDTLAPGCFPERSEVDERDPLTGQYVLAEINGNHHVLNYVETPELADELARKAVAELTDPESETPKGERVTKRLEDYESKPTSILIQDFHGNQSAEFDIELEKMECDSLSM
jgi:hypothetical protein